MNQAPPLSPQDHDVVPRWRDEDTPPTGGVGVGQELPAWKQQLANLRPLLSPGSVSVTPVPLRGHSTFGRFVFMHAGAP